MEKRLYGLLGGKVEAYEFTALERRRAIIEHSPLQDLSIRPGRAGLRCMVRSHRKVIVPFGGDHIEAGDHVVILACESGHRQSIWRTRSI